MQLRIPGRESGLRRGGAPVPTEQPVAVLGQLALGHFAGQLRDGLLIITRDREKGSRNMPADKAGGLRRPSLRLWQSCYTSSSTLEQYFPDTPAPLAGRGPRQAPARVAGIPFGRSPVPPNRRSRRAIARSRRARGRAPPAPRGARRCS